MKIYKFLPIAMACTLCVSCTDKQEEVLESQGKVTFFVPDFEAEVLTDTRMAVTISADGAAFSWTEGDTLGIFPAEGFQTAFPISGGTCTSTAEFDGGAWALRPTMEYAAYYPFQHPMDAINKNALTFNYTGQKQIGNNQTTHLGGYDYLVAPYTPVSANGNTTFMFAHLGALVRIKLKVPKAGQFTHLSLKSDGAPFVTSGVVNLTEPSPTLSPTSTDEFIILKLNNIKTTEDNEILTFYMMMAPTNQSDAHLSVWLSGGIPNNYKGVLTGKSIQAGTIYGFSLEQMEKPIVNGHEYVDLGLPSGLKWATCNVGATNPEGYGNYYTWQSASTAAFGWGGGWRLPSVSEKDELVQNCNYKWTSLNGVKGGLFTSKLNGNSIFLPAAGQNNGSIELGTQGDYWTSTKSSGSGSASSYFLGFSSGGTSHGVGDPYIYMSVRAVCQ